MHIKNILLLLTLSIVIITAHGYCATNPLNVRNIISPNDQITLGLIESLCNCKLENIKGQYQLNCNGKDMDEVPLVLRRLSINYDTVVTPKVGTFEHHISRSGSPGIDIDITYLDTDAIKKLKQHCAIPWYKLKPIVQSPVSGKLIIPESNKDGTIIIKDENGFFHKILHLVKEDAIVHPPLREFPRTVTTTLKNGQKVKKGDTIAYLGNTETKKDHVHYSIYKRANNDCTEFYDPEKVLFKEDTGAVIIPNGINPCLSCRRKLSIDNVYANIKTILKRQGSSNIVTGRVRESLNVSGKLNKLNEDKKICGKSIVNEIRWKYRRYSGTATINDGYWFASITPFPSPNDKIFFSYIGSKKTKNLGTTSLILQSTDIGTLLNCYDERPETKDPNGETQETSRITLSGDYHYIFSGNEKQALLVNSVKYEYHADGEPVTGTTKAFSNGKVWSAYIPTSAGSFEKNVGIKIELTFKSGKREFKKKIKLFKCNKLEFPPQGFSLNE